MNKHGMFLHTYFSHFLEVKYPQKRPCEIDLFNFTIFFFLAWKMTYKSISRNFFSIAGILSSTSDYGGQRNCSRIENGLWTVFNQSST